MILALFTVDCGKNAKAFQGFADLAHQRYEPHLGHPVESLRGNTWFSTLKPYQSSAFPFLVMDLMVQLRGFPCQVFFGQDLLELSGKLDTRSQLTGPLREKVDGVLTKPTFGQPDLRFHGFGHRIDIALNALGALYIDMLSSLTRVEADVISTLRALQYERHGTPTEIRTFGLQKYVAEKLGKTPVAVHKSLRSSKFDLIARTANAMRDLLT